MLMTAIKTILVALGIAATFGILWWFNSPTAAAGLEIVLAGVFCLPFLSRARSRERWALALFALIAVLLLLTGVGDLWRFGGASSANAYRALTIAGTTARGIGVGCIVALWASSELSGKKCVPSTQPSNQTLELTASRRDNNLLMTSLPSLAATRALARSSSAWSR